MVCDGHTTRWIGKCGGLGAQDNRQNLPRWLLPLTSFATTTMCSSTRAGTPLATLVSAIRQEIYLNRFLQGLKTLSILQGRKTYFSLLFFSHYLQSIIEASES